MTLRLNGSTSGYVEIEAPATAGSNTIVLPSGNGSANQLLKNGSTAGTLGWSSMVEDSSGRLLVGTSSTSVNARVLLQANPSNAVAGANLYLARGEATPSNGANLGFIAFSDSNHNAAAGINGDRDGGTWTSGSSQPTRLTFVTTPDGSASPVERMRISANGFVTFGNTKGIPFHIDPQDSTGSNFPVKLIWRRSNGPGQSACEFYTNTNVVGSITINDASVSFNTSSDYRLKENVVPLTGAIDRVNQLQVHRFNFISDPDKTVDGFIAHEAQAVVPECVTGTKDEVDDEGNPVYQGIDQSKLVPLLTAALQEALAKIEILESRLTALEAQP